MAALAGFFGVQLAYFTDDDAYAQRLDRELDWLLAARDDEVRTLTLAIAALTPQQRKDVRAQLVELSRHYP